MDGEIEDENPKKEPEAGIEEKVELLKTVTKKLEEVDQQLNDDMQAQKSLLEEALRKRKERRERMQRKSIQLKKQRDQLEIKMKDAEQEQDFEIAMQRN